jgi:hypothetical protein
MREDRWIAKLLMVGSRADKLQPTIVIFCWNGRDCQSSQGKEKVRKRVRKVVKRFESLRRTSLPYKVAVAELQLLAKYLGVETTQRSEIGSVEAHIPSGASSLCGVLLRVDAQNGQAVDFCTLGGLLYLKDRVYGLTAGHPFEQELEADLDADQALGAPAVEDVLYSGESDSEDSAFEDYEVETSVSDGSSSASPLPARPGSRTENMQSKPFKPFGIISEKPNNKKCNSDWALISIGDHRSILPNCYMSPETDDVVVIEGSAETRCPRGATVTVLTAASGVTQGKIGQSHVIMRHGKWDYEVSQVIMSKPLGKLKPSS